MGVYFIKNWLAENYDICFLTETHMTKGKQFFINSFVCFHNAYSEADCEHPRGGVSYLVSETFMQYIVSVNTDMDNFIKLIVSGNHVLFGNYIPPVDSIYFSEDCFADVRK